MGFESSTLLVYGFTLAESGEQLAQRLKLPPKHTYDEEQLTEALSHLGPKFKGLEVMLCGKNMGDKYWSIVAARSIRTVVTGRTNVMMLENTMPHLAHLSLARYLLELVDECPIGWQLLTDVY